MRSCALPVLAQVSIWTLLAADVVSGLATELRGSRMAESTLYFGASRTELAGHFLQLVGLSALVRPVVHTCRARNAEIGGRLYPLEEAAATTRTTTTRPSTNALRLREVIGICILVHPHRRHVAIMSVIVIVIAVLGSSHLTVRELRNIDRAGAVREGRDDLRLLLVHLVERQLLLGGEVRKHAWVRIVERTATVHAILVHSPPGVHVSAIVHEAVVVAEAIQTRTAGALGMLLILKFLLVRSHAVQRVV